MDSCTSRYKGVLLRRLSNSGIAWIEYKKDDQDINKGELYNNDNTGIRFTSLDSF